MLHRIDKYILKELLTHDSLPFSELRPPGVESNTLTYRLQRFAKEGLIRKSKDGHYVLTAIGRRFTDRLNLGKFIPRELAKPLTLIVCRRGDQWLLYQRYIHPLKDLAGLPHANLKPGESLIDSAERRLREKVGIKTKLVYRGGGYLTFYKDRELEGYNQINIVENITPPVGKLIEEAEAGMGRNFWQKNPDFSEAKYIPSLKSIEIALRSNPKQLFFIEKTFDL